MNKIEFHTNNIDISAKRVDGTRKVTIEVDPYEHDKLLSILILPEQYRLKVTLTDEPIEDELEVKL